MMELKKNKGEKELTKHHTGTPPEANKIKHTQTHSFAYRTSKNGKSTNMMSINKNGRS